MGYQPWEPSAYKYVVVYLYLDTAFYRRRETKSKVFKIKEEAATFAMQCGGTVFGMNPRYEFSVELKEVNDE